MKPSVRTRIAVYAVLYFGLITLAPLPDRLILFPTSNRLDTGAAVRKTIPFQSGDLEIWTARSTLAQQRGQPEIYVLRFYGNADRADRWVAAEAEMWNNRAVEVWGMNYPGFGRSTGPARLARLGPAALAAFDELQKMAANRPIIVFGASLGTTTALHIAAHRKIAGLILHNPPALRQIILRQFGWWNLWMFAGPMAYKIPADLDSVANARTVHAPSIFLLAEKDEVVAPKFQRLVVDAYGGETRIISLPGAGHNSPIEGVSLANFHEAIDWLVPR
ncbi:MAG TPA: alpha/beta fold hydrolase [Chthoniobacterales bacterium]|nr:alpha/beta fold hydrolase [Chthoniobacterales bacterium]